MNVRDAILSLFLALAMGFDLGMILGRHSVLKNAIEHGCAYYHPETASLTWKGEQ